LHITEEGEEMAEILGLGLTHYPPLIAPDEDKLIPLKRTLRTNQNLPAEMKNPSNWPEPMRVEYGEDEGYASSLEHRARLVAGFRRIREELDAFNPDFVVIWGDDQYENFREDIIPPFCVLAYDDFECHPFTNRDGSPRRNVWGEAADSTFNYRGHKNGARALVSGMIDRGIDMSYAYQPLHEPGLGHAILNTLLYLDYDRKGFDYPVVPFLVNCYGSRVIRNKGGSVEYSPDPDPPSPSPKRCLEVGSAAAQALKESPWRVRLDRIFFVVSRLPHREKLLAIPRHRVGSCPLRGNERRGLPGLVPHLDRPGGGRGSTGTAQLDVPRRRYGHPAIPGPNRGLVRDVHFQLYKMPGHLQVAGTRSG
jgi:hypothetical protein